MTCPTCHNTRKITVHERVTMTTPLHYKMIPTQYVFMVEKDGTLNIKPVSDVPSQIKFDSVKEAEEYIESYKEQL